MKRVKESKWKDDIKVIILIHDAIYLLIKEDLECLEWANNALIEEMSWQELPELKHDIVKLGANLEVYYPDWSHPIKIANKANQQEIHQTIQNNL